MRKAKTCVCHLLNRFTRGTVLDLISNNGQGVIRIVFLSVNQERITGHINGSIVMFDCISIAGFSTVVQPPVVQAPSSDCAVYQPGQTLPIPTNLPLINEVDFTAKTTNSGDTGTLCIEATGRTPFTLSITDQFITYLIIFGFPPIPPSGVTITNCGSTPVTVCNISTLI
ncbi:hypothetical protein [Fictibacillus fluitans]|uniref:DUF3992 domain-containing protein n=1 Tax=Fictibacillus fluitans TaxID=3058422 RepID=A0ABT8HYW0_9BACL|nr:hypothetical protein [Fictibacillus sp. NE201]MDN4525938.1 hypothetical protein [Fictibacillus sp. NE201]